MSGESEYGFMANNRGITSIETTLDVIETLASLGEAGVSELADELGLANSTVHDHLVTLERRGYVVKHERRYRAGTKFLGVGTQIRRHLEVFNVAKPELKRLADETGEHVNLMIEEDGIGVLLYTVMGENAVQVVAHDGSRTLLHITAPGKVILAHLPDERVEEILDRYGLPAETKNTITDEGRLMEELDQIRERGYGIDREESLEGMWGVAVPIIRRDNDEIRGAISVYGPRSRTDAGEFEEDLPQLLLKAANVIEVNLTYS